MHIRILLFLSFFFGILSESFAQKKTIQIPITRRLCNQWVVGHTPSSDVAYHPGRDTRGKSVVPADLGGGIQIKPPKVITIPIRLDVRKFMGPQQEQLLENSKKLDENRAILNQNQTQIASNFTVIQGNKTSIDQNLQALTQEFADSSNSSKTPEEVAEIFSQNLTLLEDSLNKLDTHPGQIQQNTTLLQENTETLAQQFSAFEENQNVIQRNNDAQVQNTTSAGTTGTHIDQSVSALETLSSDLQKTKTLLEDNSAAVGDQLDTLNETLSSLETRVTSSKETFSESGLSDSENSQKATLDSLSSTLNDLGVKNQENVFVEHAELGQITAHLDDGRLYFNGQPLQNEHEAALKAACRKRFGK